MPFFKTASSAILGVYQSSGKFSKRASQNRDIAVEADERAKNALNLLSQDTLKAIAHIYNLSDNIDDYIFPVARSVTGDVPNNNGDNFKHDELTRFSADHRCLVYETFRNDPLHIEHVADDPKAARGYNADVYYVTGNAKDKYVLNVLAVDTTKDEPFATAILNGDIDSFSMGCICEAVQCSYPSCKKIAYSDKELCDHQKYYKMSRINGQLIYQDCLGVEFKELSAVSNPADSTALTQAFLRHAASQHRKARLSSEFTLISQLLSQAECYEVSRYFGENVNKLPDSMLKLADKLF